MTGRRSGKTGGGCSGMSSATKIQSLSLACGLAAGVLMTMGEVPFTFGNFLAAVLLTAMGAGIVLGELHR